MAETKPSPNDTVVDFPKENPLKITDTPYDEPYRSIIKQNIKDTWERVKSTRGLTQSALSQALNLSQGAVSKLMSDINGHPWTVDKIKIFAEFCRVPLIDILGKDNQKIVRFFNDWTGETIPPSEQLVEECFEAINRYFTRSGRSLPKDRLIRLAAMLAARVEPTDRKKEDFDAQILNVILDEAAKAT